jgi:hypothetical protein
MGQDPDAKSDNKSESKPDDEAPDAAQMEAEPSEYPAIGVVNVAEGANPDIDI